MQYRAKRINALTKCIFVDKKIKNKIVERF